MQQRAVGVEDLPGRDGAARRHYLIAGHQQGDARGAMALHLADAGHGQRRNAARGEPDAGRGQSGSGLKLLATKARVLARRQRGFEHDPVAVTGDDFLPRHGVGAGRQAAAGEDARGLTGSDVGQFTRARRHFADQRERHRRSTSCRCQVGAAQRVTVHGALREHGQVGGGHRCFGQHPTQGVGQWRGLRGQR